VVAISVARDPDIRTMPMPPRPVGVAIAAIVSSLRFVAAVLQAVRSTTVLIRHCWSIDSRLFTNQ